MTKRRTERDDDTGRVGVAVSAWVLLPLVLLASCARSTAATRGAVDAAAGADVEDATPRDTPTSAEAAAQDVVSVWPTCSAGPVLDADVLGVRVRGKTILRLFRGDAVATSVRSVSRACEPGGRVRPHIIRYTVRDGTVPIAVFAASQYVTMWATARCEDVDEALACRIPVRPWPFNLAGPSWMVVPPRPAGSSLYLWVDTRGESAQITVDEHPELPDTPCRTASPRCDPGFACTAPHALAAGSCVPAAAHDRDCRVLAREPPRACDGEDCVPGTSGWRCAPLGSLHARCRAGATACDDGLACTPSPDGFSGYQTCEVPLPSGAPCEASSQMGVCPRDEVCPREGGSGRCGARGMLLADCRDAEPRCDPGLECREIQPEIASVCYPIEPVGSPCPLSGRCPGALGCTVDPPTSSGTCRTSYVRGGPCLGWCRDGSACRRTSATLGLCVAPLRLGDPCSFAGERSCGQDMTCVGQPDGSARCARDGTEGAYRRLDAHPCDEGLVPTIDGRCRWPLGLGDPCGARPCIDGFSCVRGVCRAEGTQDARCRNEVPDCDEGLVCVPHGDTAVCIRARQNGELCFAPGAVTAGCAAGTECRGGFCAATGVKLARCRNVPPGEPRCEEGQRCLYGSCRPTVATGAPCLNSPGMGPVACQEGDRCVPGDGEAVFRCRAPGTLGGEARATEPFCDEGLVRARNPVTCWAAAEACDNAPICVQLVPPGSACDDSYGIRQCSGWGRCVRSVCEVHGACDPSASDCGPGYVCHAWPEWNDPRCQPTAREGEACGAIAPVCEDPLECRDGVCTRAYDVTVLRDVALDDPCVQARNSGWGVASRSAQQLPFPFSVMGSPVRGPSINPTGGFWLPLVDAPFSPYRGGNEPEVRIGLQGVGLDTEVQIVNCVRVFGEAPTRRYVFELRGVGVGVSSDPSEDRYCAMGAIQLILHEQERAVDIAFRAFVNTRGVPRRLVAAPQLRLDARIVRAPATVLAEGTVFRFTPH